MNALEKAKESNNYFDELMFMYEEDCDLVYRLKLAGFKSKFVNDAIIYHDRTASSQGENNLDVIKNRKNKNKNIRRWAFLNKHIMFVKYWKTLNFKEKYEVFYFAFRMFVFSCIFEPFLLKQYFVLLKNRKKINTY
jgi:GT2 family glycosyltransferase